MDQLYRTTDPHTSISAAGLVSAFGTTHEAKIYAAICNAGARGATFREIAAATGMEPVAVARRLIGLERRGLIARRMNAQVGRLESRGGCCVWWVA